jgi:type I restriction-modification system DNA methylase subunit
MPKPRKQKETNDSGLNVEAQFSMSNWGGENLRQELCWAFEIPLVNNANYALIQHFIRHFSSVCVAGFVMANGSMSKQTDSKSDIRCTIQRNSYASFAT